MKVISINCENFRNLKELEVQADANINVIYGDNAQGKTNIIEAINLFSGSKSFRGAKDKEQINFDSNFCRLKLIFSDKDREQQAEIKLLNSNINEKERTQIKREITLNNVPIKSYNELLGNFYSIVFSPTHLSLIKDGPSGRRQFIDTAMCQINKRYCDYLTRYEKILKQRNALIKDIKKFADLESTLDIWDTQLAKLGTIITIYRNEYIAKLKKTAIKFYSGFSKGGEELGVKYVSNTYESVGKIEKYTDSNIKVYFDRLKDSFSDDLGAGFTTVGIHRDDINFMVDQNDVRIYGSQGQQRSVVISVKLAEANILKEIINEAPIVLLDDVLSELDLERQDYILNNLKDFQVFITCCDPENAMRLVKGKVLHIDGGALRNADK